MSSRPWKTHPKNKQLQVLNVPAFAQEESESECVINCIWMSLQYLGNFHPNRWIRNDINLLSLEEIKRHISVDETGWTPDADELESLNEEIGPVKFRHTLNQDNPTNAILYRIINEHLNNNLPVIPFVNARKLRRGKKGGVHAVVVTGMNDRNIAINDPWGYLYDTGTCLAPETEGRESVQNRHVQILICKFQLPYTGLAQCSPMR